MKAIIVDDEGKSRRMLKALCEEYCEELEIVALAASVAEATILIEEKKPDLVFLDIQMPVKSGFSLLQQYEGNIPFHVVFTTAHDQYALKAFKFSAIDYLLKPINIDELIDAVKKVKQINYNTTSTEKLRILKEILAHKNSDKIALTTLDSLNVVKFKDIVRCEAKGNYTSIYLSNGNVLLITKTLKYYDDLLVKKDFFRVHKSHLINLRYVRKFIKGKQAMVEMTDGKKIEVSVRKRYALLQKLSLST